MWFFSGRRTGDDLDGIASIVIETRTAVKFLSAKVSEHIDCSRRIDDSFSIWKESVIQKLGDCSETEKIDSIYDELRCLKSERLGMIKLINLLVLVLGLIGALAGAFTFFLNV